MSRAVPTLLDRLELVVPGASRRTLRQMLENGRVLVDGVEARRGSDPVPDGAKLTVLPRSAMSAAPPVPILFEDEHLMVVDKPEGLLTVSTRSAGRESLWSSLRRMLKARGKGEQIHLVHRLDERASGLLVFAKSEKAKRALKNLFERHDIDRRYAALVEGSLPGPAGEFRSRLAPIDEPRHRVRSVTPRDPGALKEIAREAITRYTVRGGAKGITAVEVRLETGRKHQIRVHFAEAGHPVVGDVLYGAASASRLCLHAWVLGFAHPITKAPMRFVSKPASEIAERVRGAFDAPLAPATRDGTPSPRAPRRPPSGRREAREGSSRRPGRGAR